MKSVEDRKAELVARLADLKARVQGIEAELESHHAQDWEELAVEREGDEVLEGMGLSAQQEIRMIEAALARVAAGEFGACVKCGADISAARLDVVPFTPFCRDCAA